MHNFQLKAGYNVQYGVDSEYITWVIVGSKPSDTTMLIPFLLSMQSNLNFKYIKIITNSGYESEENYLFLKTNNRLVYIT